MNFRLYIPILISIICLLSSCVNGQTKAEQYFFKAYECKNLDCQLNFLNKSIDSNSKFAPAIYGKSFIYFIQNKHSEKQLNLDKAFELSPDYIEIYTSYKQIYDLYPNNKYVLVLYGGLLEMQGYENKALELYNKAIKIDPKFPQAYYGRGFYYETKSENKKALADYGKAIELDSEFANALHRHGDMLAVTFIDFEKGIFELNKAIKLNPNFEAAYNSRAVAYKLKGEYEKAVPDLNKSIELNPNNYLIYYFRASIYRELGKIELAEKDELKAKELESKNNKLN